MCCICLYLLRGTNKEHLEALARFLARVRQSRRSLREQFVELHKFLNGHNFAKRQMSWKMHGRHVCRHGMFFDKSDDGCDCMARTPFALPQNRPVLMPKLSEEVKAIIVVEFDGSTAKRIGQLRAEMKRRRW